MQHHSRFVRLETIVWTPAANRRVHRPLVRQPLPVHRADVAGLPQVFFAPGVGLSVRCGGNVEDNEMTDIFGGDIHHGSHVPCIFCMVLPSQVYGVVDELTEYNECNAQGRSDCEAKDVIAFPLVILFYFFAGIWLTVAFFVSYGTKNWVRAVWINLFLCRLGDAYTSERN